MEPRSAAVAVSALIAVAVGAYFYVGRPSEPPRKPPPPIPEVGVVELRRADVPLPLTYAGRVAGFRNVEVRPQVGGLILKREYAEGAKVKQNDVLFRLDERPYQAALDRANAQLAQAQATANQAEENFRRVEELFHRQVATAKQFEEARAARDQAQATIQAAQADIQTAKLNIEFTTIKAPVTGATSLQSPPEGSLALAQQTVLTTITQLDPAYVNFATSESEFLQLREMNRARERPLTPDDITVRLQFGDVSSYPEPGKLDVTASTVDPKTGTLQIRSVFQNAGGVLLPNQFVRVQIIGISLQDVFVVPERAVSQGPQGPFVYIVNSSNNGVAARPIKLDREVEGGWAVRAGLESGEKLVVEGMMRVRPGAPVNPVPLDSKKSDQASSDAEKQPANGVSQAK
ncbi:MAG: efflux RND transporter periplasmic adaptor subunit [Bradyrhizobium sp.]|jgi:membrane fusion protein (multidrug efflux system)